MKAVPAGPDRPDLEMSRNRFDSDAMTVAEPNPNIWSDGDEFDHYPAPHSVVLALT